MTVFSRSCVLYCNRFQDNSSRLLMIHHRLLRIKVAQ